MVPSCPRITYWMVHGSALLQGPGRRWDKWGAHSQGLEGLQLKVRAFFNFVPSVPFCHSCLPGEGRKSCPDTNTHETLGLLPRNVGSWDRRVFVKKEPWNLLLALGWERREPGTGGEGRIRFGTSEVCERLYSFLRLLGQGIGAFRAFPLHAILRGPCKIYSLPSP